MAAGIDVQRAQVQLQAQQQRLIVAENDFAKKKLVLARAIGLPLGQELTLTDGVPYAEFPLPGLDAALEMAYRNRGDYLSALDRVKAAELQRKAALGKGRPSLNLDANYGIIGQRVDQNHGTFAVAASLNIPIFEGGKVRGEVLEADAGLRKRQAEAEELRARTYYEIRSSFLDLQSARDRVKVAQGAEKLAEEQLRESKDRFAAGVANTIEVVQSQETLAELDTRDYDVAVRRARADLAEAEAQAKAASTQVPITSTTTANQVSAARAMLSQAQSAVAAAASEVETARARLALAQARVREARVNHDKTVQDLQRLKPLIAKDEVSQQDYDNAVSAEDAARRAGFGAGGGGRGPKGDRSGAGSRRPGAPCDSGSPGRSGHGKYRPPPDRHHPRSRRIRSRQSAGGAGEPRTGGA